MNKTNTLLLVLAVFLENPGRNYYCLDLMNLTHISAGTMYSILYRLKTDGWLSCNQDPHSNRRYYQITERGIYEANLAMS